MFIRVCAMIVFLGVMLMMFLMFLMVRCVLILFCVPMIILLVLSAICCIPPVIRNETNEHELARERWITI